MIVALMALTTPAAAGWTLPCLFGRCSITFVSPEYAALPVQKLDPEAALAEVNAFRTKNRRKQVVLDAELRRRITLGCLWVATSKAANRVVVPWRL